ncbi:PucR family transcriptional regulator [Streptomyces iranensis]|uniref:PucR family transcriptional regulator n=1 Tax=Streptomyces iranensis TaxID=576784 RepID=UPI0039B77A21
MRDDYQQLVDEITAVLRAPATLENRDFALIAFGAQDSEDSDDTAEPALDPVRTRSILQRRSTAAVRAWFEAFGIARAQAPLRIPPDPAAGVFMGRICLPVRHRGVVHGYVWLLDDGHLADLELGGPAGARDPRLVRAMETADRIGALLATEARAGEELGELLRDALTGPPAGRDAARSGLRTALRGAADGPLALVAVVPWTPGTGEDADHPGLPHLPGIVAACALLGDAAAGAAGAPGAGLAALVRLRAASALDPARATAEQLLRSPRATAGGRGPRRPAPRAAAGVSAPRRGLEDLPAAWQEALAAARAAHADTHLGPVAEWSAIGPYRLLAALPALPPDAAVRPLLEPAHVELARTAETFLDCAGQAGRTAQRLGIHRQTLYYRLSRVRQLTGLDLDAGEDRLLLHMTLKAARLGPQGR